MNLKNPNRKSNEAESCSFGRPVCVALQMSLKSKIKLNNQDQQQSHNFRTENPDPGRVQSCILKRGKSTSGGGTGTDHDSAHFQFEDLSLVECQKGNVHHKPYDVHFRFENRPMIDVQIGTVNHTP